MLVLASLCLGYICSALATGLEPLSWALDVVFLEPGTRYAFPNDGVHFADRRISYNKLLLLCWWMFVLSLLVLAPRVNHHHKSGLVNQVRKYFHGIAVLLFVPGVLFAVRLYSGMYHFVPMLSG